MISRAIIFRIVLAMLAFSANSILCRLALKGEHIDPLTFTNLRLISGAIVLLPFLLKRDSLNRLHWSIKNSFFLMIYALCFSVAYISLDAGTGALLLFGVVQLTMILYGLFKGEKITLTRGTGIILAIIGMAVLLLPGAKAPPVLSSLLMGVSGFAWAVYSILGKKASRADLSTTANFILASCMAFIVTLLINVHGSSYDTTGIILAIASGACASAGAYILWYTLLPHLESVTASTVQLSVPCLAMLGGVIFLGESLTLRMIISTLSVLIGIFLVIKTPKNR